jgi:hypothetical protein
MPGIYTAAIITTVLALLILGRILLRKAPREELPVLAAVMMLVLPMNPLVFNFIRLPLDGFMKSWFFTNPDLYGFLTTLYAPLTEEPAKLWVLLIPWVYSRINKDNFWRFALAIGLGFGIGEMWLIAAMIAKDPALSVYKWYELSGYMGERLMVCVLHAALTSLSLFMLRRNFMLGFLGSMFMHWMANFPIYLSHIDFMRLGNAFWQQALGIWILLYFAAALLMFVMLARKTTSVKAAVRSIYGKAKCPGCGFIYNRPFLALNLLTRRYERCPGCGKFHLTKDYEEPKAKAV